MFISRLCLECECVLAKSISISINKQYIRLYIYGSREKTSVFVVGVVFFTTITTGYIICYMLYNVFGL